MKFFTSTLLFVCLSLAVPTKAFMPLQDATTLVSSSLKMGKGFGGGGGGSGFGATQSSSKKKKPKKSEVKKTQKKILKKYGSNVAEGTQRRVNEAMNELPPHLHVATQLYQQLQKWNVRLENMSVLQQAQMAPEEMEGARRAQEELDRLYEQHNFNQHDLHNVFQQITWDASADAKAARAITGDMPKEIQAKVDRACQIVAETAANDNGRCLDIGCGFGVLVPHLVQCGLAPSQIHGIDLSKEMIRNAREQHRGVNFEAVDFMNDYQYEEGFEGVIFCSALHDLSDPVVALKKASSLVKPKGKLVVAHPQGASHVLRQSAANPVLVQRGLPTAEELRSMELKGMTLEVAPAEPNSSEEATEGYLAVFTKES